MVLLVPRVGFAVGGSGEISEDCSGSLCASTGKNAEDTADDSGLIVAADLLFRLGSVVRLGPTFMYSLDSAVKIETEEADVDAELGQELTGGLALELDVEASDAVGILFRVQTGASVLFVDGELKDTRLQIRNQCAMASLACTRAQDPFVAFHYGFGAGLLGHLEKITLRGEAGIHFANYGFADKLEAPPFTADVQSQLDTSRIVVLLGIEI